MKTLMVAAMLTFWSVISGAVAPAFYEFTYKTEFLKPAGDFKTWEAWIPFPADGPGQKLSSYKINTTAKFEITTAKDGNRMIHFSGLKRADLPLTVEAVYRVERSEASTAPLESLRGKAGWNPQNYLHPDRKIPLDGKIAKLGAEQTQGAKNDGEKIRRAYHYVVQTMSYNKDGKGWGEGDALWACDNKRGNCTDFHSLFIGMVRSQKVPAKFEIGFPIPPTGEGPVPGYHCWAWAYDRTNGWIPADASEAKKHGQMFEYLGRIGNDRIRFTSGRDLILAPAQKGEPLNYFIYPYVEIDGMKSDGVKKEFSVKKAV